MAMVELERAIQKLDGGSAEDEGIMLFELWKVRECHTCISIYTAYICTVNCIVPVTDSFTASF